MAKRKKASKVQTRAKLRRGNSAKRGKARKAARAKTVAKAKPKRAPVKKAARKVKQLVAPVVEAVAETVAAEVIEQPAPGVISVTEVEETEIRKAGWGHCVCDFSATPMKNYAVVGWDYWRALISDERLAGFIGHAANEGLPHSKRRLAGPSLGEPDHAQYPAFCNSSASLAT